MAILTNFLGLCNMGKHNLSPYSSQWSICYSGVNNDLFSFCYPFSRSYIWQKSFSQCILSHYVKVLKLAFASLHHYEDTIVLQMTTMFTVVLKECKQKLNMKLSPLHLARQGLAENQLQVARAVAVFLSSWSERKTINLISKCLEKNQ